MPRGPQGLPKAVRIRSRLDFERLQETGRRASRGKILGLWMTSGQAPARLGITASRKVGGAVVRNRAKRWIREWFRKRKSALPKGLWLVVVLRAGAVEAGHAVLEQDLDLLAAAIARGR